MARVTLTPTQQAVLDRMVPGQWYTERELQVQFATMIALRRRGLVTCRYGSFISRSTEWQRKDEPQ